MSGLPPTGPNNKVSVRSKTASFKRPISCDVSEHKKDSKGMFSKLKKGSSNSRLDEESQYGDGNLSLYKFNNNFHNNKDNLASLPSRIQGRNFDSDDDDYELDTGETIVTKMEKLFNNHHKVIKNPALVGSVLKYLITHNQDYYSLLFYLIAQHYKSTIQTKDFQKEALKFFIEIYTTFLHNKSILRISHTDFKPIVFEDLKTTKDFSTVFDDCCHSIFNHCIVSNIEKVKTSIAHGLFTVESNIEVMSFDEKLAHFNSVIKFIVQNLNDRFPREQTQNVTKESKEQELFLSDVMSAVKSSLATIYCYFCKKEKDESSDSTSIMSSKINSFLGKSTENLQMMTNCVLEKQPMFCSKIHKRPGSHSFFKKGKVQKGHNFQEKAFEHPAECLLCEKLLWGIAPQGFICSHCQGASHRNCKDFVKIICQKDLRKYQRASSNVPQPIEDDQVKNSIIEEKPNDEIINKNTENKDITDKAEINESDEKLSQIEIETVTEEPVQISTSSMSSDVSHIIKPSYVISTATIVVTNNDEKPNDSFDTESLDSVLDIYPSLDKDSAKSESDKLELRSDEKKYLSPSYVPAGHVKTMANKYDQKTIPRSQSNYSDNNIESSTLPRINKRTSESVHVQDLLQDASMWSDDPDMEVGETFEADKELEAFPEHLSKEQDKAEYTRLLVLMEFHHKTKFTVMTLKRFDYLLIKSWPIEDTLLFKTLSLDCIVPLYGLIKMLANTIESCREKSSFTSDTAKKVYDWLVSNDEANLQEWLKYSIDLCCTNSLILVKNTWKDSRKSDPRFHSVLNKRFNKMIMVEQLSNMRPLLFNFPLIVNKLVRDLTKFSKFKEEVKIWKEIHEKFKRLPTFIDEHCMPLVQLINSGTIVNSIDRSGWISKLSQSDPCYDYIIDFPKTAFHYKLFDFQEIKISNFRESGNKIKTPAVFVKETCDAYAICYENILVLLQKENDKYVLKQFKATDASKCNPILIVENVHTSKGEKKGMWYELTLVFINVAVLTQVLFHKKDIMERWHDFIYKIKNKNIKKTESFNNNSDKSAYFPEHFVLDELTKEDAISNNIDSDHKLEDDGETSEDKHHYQLDDEFGEHLIKFENMRESTDEYLSYMNLMKPDQQNGESSLFLNPNDSNELLLGTTYDVGNLLKLCNDSFRFDTLNKSRANYVNEEILDQLLLCLSVMQNRIATYKNSRDKDTLSINDIDYTISDNIEPSFQSIQDTPQESLVLNESEDTDEIPFQTMDNPVPATTDIDINDTDTYPFSTTTSDFVSLPTVEDSSSPREYDQSADLTSFVDDYVNKIIVDAQREINESNDSDSSSVNQSNDGCHQQDSSSSHQISEPSA